MPSPRKRREMKAKQGRLDSYQEKAAGKSVEKTEEPKAEIQIEESAPEVIEAVETEEIAEEVEEIEKKPAPKAKSSRKKSSKKSKSEDSE